MHIYIYSFYFSVFMQITDREREVTGEREKYFVEN